MAARTSYKTSVCILGAGPAGTILGNLLLKNGIDCIVVDKYSREEIHARGRAGLIESTTAELLSAHGLADTLLANADTHHSCEFRYPNRSIVFDYGALNGGEMHYVYPQSDLNEDLIQKYLDAGGQLHLGCAGQEIRQQADGVVVKCGDRVTGEILEIHADFVAGCDGYHGISRRSVPANAVKTFTK